MITYSDILTGLSSALSLKFKTFWAVNCPLCFFFARGVIAGFPVAFYGSLVAAFL